MLVWLSFNSLAIKAWMGTCMLLRVMLTSAKRLLRSLAKMSMVDLKLSLVAFWAHSALTQRSRWEVSSKAFSTLMQSRLWMETP